MAVKGRRTGGTTPTINAKNGANTHLSSDRTLTNADTLYDGGAVQNTSYAAGDVLTIQVKSVSGSPTQVLITVYFTRA